MMKKIFTIFLALTMVVGLLAGCGKKNSTLMAFAAPLGVLSTGTMCFRRSSAGCTISRLLYPEPLNVTKLQYGICLSVGSALSAAGAVESVPSFRTITRR